MPVARGRANLTCEFHLRPGSGSNVKFALIGRHKTERVEHKSTSAVKRLALQILSWWRPDDVRTHSLARNPRALFAELIELVAGPVRTGVATSL